ncbi:AAA family ATPase [Streptobacillus moniliformis]|uniref:AAA family ATPase n=1 Tax=Streptobacillus moniliformis TaxID=34105 RepID=UPI0007E4BA8D|nr:AAA family ATPase [Streptobacillus moniliformis]
MITLPKNKPKEFNKTPRIFFIWGESMSGKTYLARQFPNPILLNTDGNSDKVDTPSVEIKNFIQFTEIIDIIGKGNHSFETILIDLIDDIDTMLINYICNKNNVESLADIPYGKGFSMYNGMWKNLMMMLSKMKYNIIFISHIIEKIENNNSIFYPALPQKPLNICLGRCDLQIQTKKLGTTYMKIITNKRDRYVQEDIKNITIAKALEGTIGLFDKTTVPTKTNNIITPNNNKINIKNEGNDK